MADADLLREMIGFATEHLMELEVGNATGVDFGEKNPMLLAELGDALVDVWSRLGLPLRKDLLTAK